MVDEFEDHPVTQEVWAGNLAENTSGLLGGYGNLFSFIGFDEGDDPISPISLILRQRITHSIKRTNDRGGYMVTINLPSQESLDSVSQIPWMKGKSWLDGIENGIAGLNRYLYDEEGFDNSRSETGIQARNLIRGVSQGRTPYLSQILDNFKKRLTRLT